MKRDYVFPSQAAAEVAEGAMPPDDREPAHEGAYMRGRQYPGRRYARVRQTDSGWVVTVRMGDSGPPGAALDALELAALRFESARADVRGGSD